MDKATTYRKRISASTKNLAEIRNFVTKYAEEQGFTADKIADIRLAVDEACTNIIKHAYQQDEREEIQIWLEFDEDQLNVIIADRGKSFDPENYHKPNLADQIKKKKRGGMGVHLMRNLMDNITYEKKDGSNILSMCKKRG